MKMWENFEKKELKKSDDFKGQLVCEKEIDEFDINIDKTANIVTIMFGHGYIELTYKEFLEGLLKEE